jgi:hypothetical protein
MLTLTFAVFTSGTAEAVRVPHRHRTPAKRTPFRKHKAKSAVHALSAATLAKITSDANWIVGNEFSNGAIAQGLTPTGSTSVYIEPYTANYAAIGLARATALTGDQTFGKASWSWLQWYASHEQSGTGFVSDSTIPYPFVSGDASTSLGTMDSTDAYAGTFLLAAYDTEVADANSTDLQGLKAGIAGAVHAITETQQSNGLTWALPTYQMAYLMDNAEAHAGLLAAASLEAKLGSATAEASDKAAAVKMEAGIQSMWNKSTNSFNWASATGGVQTTNWSNIYPDVAAQAWAVGLGATTAAQAKQLMSEVESDDPEWDAPTATMAVSGSSPSAVGYWPGIGWGFDTAGNTTEAQAGGIEIAAAATAANDYWPYSTQDSGQLIVLLSGGPTLASG